MYILLLLFEEKGILVCFFFFAVTQSHTAGVLHGQTLRAMLLLQLPTPAQLESVFVCGEEKKKRSASEFQLRQVGGNLSVHLGAIFICSIPAVTEFDESLHAALAVP